MTSSTAAEAVCFARLGTDASQPRSVSFSRIEGSATRIKLVVDISKSRQELALSGQVEKGDLI